MFRSADPVTLKTEVVCKLCEVAFEQPLEDVADWGDRQRSLQWLQASRQTSAAAKQISTAKVRDATPSRRRPQPQSLTHTSCVCVCVSADGEDRRAVLLRGGRLPVGHEALALCRL